ncbi:MAG: AcrR family transcriptional regulator [Candidatus Aldehydirespiratoraceae bacterium]|jgi:AcrR family transcriptional regulator
MATTTRSSRATALPPDQRREAIIKATLPLLLEHGELVTTRQIAEAAGVAEGTIFRVFKDKRELLAAAITAALDMGELDRRLEAIPADAAFEAQIEQAIAIYQERVAEVWQLISNFGSKLRKKLAQPFDASKGLTALFERNVAHIELTPDEASRYLRAVTLAVSHPMVSGEKMTPQQIAHLFLNGAGK